MSETPLESIRRQLKEAEQRVKKSSEAAPENPGKELEFRNFKGQSPENLQSPHLMQAAPSASAEWLAYAQMTPGFLNELARFMDDSIQHSSDQEPGHLSDAGSKMLRQNTDRVRLLLDRWIEAAELLPDLVLECSYPDLVLLALNSRRSELSKWGIEAKFQDATNQAVKSRGNPALFQAMLHILQCCIEQLREYHGASHLFVRVQNFGERLETTFLCELSGSADSSEFPETDHFPAESLRAKNLELRAAQRLLDAVGGTIVLENISETQHAIRANLNNFAFSAGQKFRQQSQS
jgi:hypothetical protein